MSVPESTTRRWMAVGLAIVIAWAVFASTASRFFGQGGMAPPSLEPLAVPRPANFDWTLLDLDGKPVEFARFKGKTILLNLWATWCGPCLEEMPSIASLAASEDLKARGIVFVCVSTDDSAESLRRFLKGKGWPMTILRATSIPPSFQTEGLPTTYLIAPDGQVVAAELGAAQWDDPSVVSFLQKLAASAARK